MNEATKITDLPAELRAEADSRDEFHDDSRAEGLRHAATRIEEALKEMCSLALSGCAEYANGDCLNHTYMSEQGDTIAQGTFNKGDSDAPAV